jgi:3-oxoacyl-[acyl-carrier protein] reductase
MNTLQGKKALVTGGASGIGQAIVQELAGLGAEVFIHYHTSREPADRLLESINAAGGRAHAAGADLSSETEVADLFKKVRHSFGGLDVLVNNAGDLLGRKPLEEISLQFYRKGMAINLDSMFLVTREAVPLMKHRGGASIVNLASQAGREGWRYARSLPYSTAKGAILTLTRGMSTELAEYGIRVNAVAPGLTLGSRMIEDHTDPESIKQRVGLIPLGRAGTCQDIARAVAFLASEYDGFITGATLDVNGGIYMG